MKFTKLLLFTCVFLCTTALVAQNNTQRSNHPTAKVKWPEGDDIKKDSGQHYQASYFVDRRAMKFALGVRFGGTAFHGDADVILPGLNGGLFAKYSISQTFGLRGEFNMGRLRGERYDQGPTAFKDNFSFVSNYQDWNLQMHFTLGNISFLRPMRTSQLYLFLGVGQGSFNSTSTFVDQRLFLGDYYLTNYFGQGAPNPNLGREVEEPWEGRRMIVPFGFGTKFYINRRIDLGLEYRMTYTRTDDIDVYNTAIFQNRFLDMYSNLNATVAFKLGNSNPQHYDWLSPVESLSDKMSGIQNKIDDLTKDSDNDGVSDFFDKDPETPDDCEVYGSGKPVDTDGDGIPDCRDEEPFSPRGAEVDERGVAIDSDGDGVPDILDMEPNTPRGAIVDASGRQIKSGVPCSDVKFPSLYFSTANDGSISPSHHGILFQIAERLKVCPDKKLIVSGFGDRVSSKYNRAVNTRRIDAMVKHLNEKYGISRDRIVTDYLGERNTNTDKEQANRRIDFRLE
jgi:outer membrane protein OmpA-like peptidoglycan-associated protein